MFAFNYSFAAGPPVWKDLPCFIQKALRSFVTESEVVYDRNFFLKKFGIIVKNPILPYKNQEFKNNLIALKLVDEKESRLRHFQQARRSLLKKYLPLYRSLREEIQINIKKTDYPTIPVLNDERLIALAAVLGPTFVATPSYYKFFKRDVPAFMSYYSQTILKTDRALRNGLWKISKYDRRILSMRIIKLWSHGRMTFPQELQKIVNDHAYAHGTLDQTLKKIWKFPSQNSTQIVVNLPHLGLVRGVKRELWRKEYDRIFILNSVTVEILNTREQINENIILRREIRAHPLLSELVQFTAQLKTRYEEKKVDHNRVIAAMFGIPILHDYEEPQHPPLSCQLIGEIEDAIRADEAKRRFNKFASKFRDDS